MTEMTAELLMFAAERAGRMRDADKELAPYVIEAYPAGDWDPVVAAASQIWLEIFDQMTPDTADYDVALTDFQDLLEESLAQTNPPGDDGPAAYQLDRITEYVSTATVNDATRAAAAVTG